MNEEGRSCRDFQAVTICCQVCAQGPASHETSWDGCVCVSEEGCCLQGLLKPMNMVLAHHVTHISYLRCGLSYLSAGLCMGFAPPPLEKPVLSPVHFSLSFFSPFFSPFSLPFSPLFSLLLPIKPVFTSRNRGKRRGGKGGKGLLLKFGVPRIKLPGYPEAGLQPPGPYCWLLEGTRWAGSRPPMILPGGEPHRQYQAPLLRMLTPASVHVPVFTCWDCIRCGVGKFGVACK